MNKFEAVKNATEQFIVQGKTDEIESFFTDSYTAHAGEKSYQGHNFIKKFTHQLRSALPDVKSSKIKLLSQTEDMLSWQRTFTGTHKAELKGIPPSNKKIKWYEIIVTRFENDKIVEEWVSSDLGFQLMLQQKA